jgi:flagellar biosynthesis/type III secretory pathway protein FliH
VVALAFNTSAPSSRPAWSTKGVPGQPGLHRETLSRKNKTKQNKTKQTVEKERKEGKKDGRQEGGREGRGEGGMKKGKKGKVKYHYASLSQLILKNVLLASFPTRIKTAAASLGDINLWDNSYICSLLLTKMVFCSESQDVSQSVFCCYG